MCNSVWKSACGHTSNITYTIKHIYSYFPGVLMPWIHQDRNREVLLILTKAVNTPVVNEPACEQLEMPYQLLVDSQ